MPIKIPNDLPAAKLLEAEGLFIMREKDAMRQDIRPLHIALLNLMPLKQKTETQIARLIAATPLQVDLTLLTTSSYQPTNVSSQHLSRFYKSWRDISNDKFDGLIITGAPVETMAFEKVKYWSELCDILAWASSNVHSCLDICWGAQAAMYYFHHIPKHPLDEKAFGIYPHQIFNKQNPLLSGFSDEVRVPVSRHTYTKAADVQKIAGLEILIDSPVNGLCLIEDKPKRHIYMLNHLEYDSTTLSDEYHRDLAQGHQIALPFGYFPDDNPDQMPLNLWRSHAHLFFANWINQIYQTVPFSRADIGIKSHHFSQ